MKKFTVLLTLTTALMFSGCSGGEVTPVNADAANANIESDAEVTPVNADAANANIESDADSSGDNTGGSIIVGSDGVYSASIRSEAGSGTGEPPKGGPGTPGNLTVAVVGEFNFYLQSAIASFKESNPNTNVDIIEYSWNLEQYSQIINTAIMSGGGEDIIDASYLSWQKLADRDKLADLDELINFTDEEYFKTILDAYLYKGKRYTVPVSFYFNAFEFTDAYRDKEPAANITLDSLLTLAEKYPNTKLIYSDIIQNGTMLADLITRLNYGDFIDIENRKADFDNDRFKDILNKAMLLKDRIATKPDEETLLRPYQIFTPEFSAWTVEYTVEGQLATASSSFGNIDYSNMFLLTNDKGQGTFTPSDIMPAINANCNQRQLAADFIKHLLSAETQASPELRFSTVNREASAVKAKEAIERAQTGGGELGGFDLAKNTEMFDSFISQLSFGQANDSQIDTFILEEISRFFDGAQTADQTAAGLQSRLALYLNE